MQELLIGGFRPGLTGLVLLVRSLLPRVHGGDTAGRTAAEARCAHLRHPDVLRPIDELRLLCPKLLHIEVSAWTFEPVVLDDFSGLLTVREAREFGVSG